MAKGIVDTSVVVGYLERGDRTLDEAIKRYDEVVVPIEVIFETVYVLESVYDRERAEIFSWLTSLLDQPKLVYDRKLILNTLFRYSDKQSLSIVDCYVLELTVVEKCGLISVDEKMIKALGN